MSFNLKDYEQVADRLVKFWTDHPNGRIETDLLAYPSPYIVKALVYRDSTDERVAATGLAQETVSDRGVNATSALENCETSAIGRALANLNYQTKGKPRPSREEMSKAQPVRQPDTVEAATSDTELMVALMQDVENALSEDALRSVWKDAAAAGRDGRITIGDFHRIENRITAVRAALGGAK